ncbi:FCD domain-containing protein [Fusobacteria bacterium ZRK30]|nr:FCD domain-containing protein [Fusobacteria bacterium ZRK30]
MKKTAIDIAYEYIEKMIVKGEWKAGDKITPEVRLAEELGISRVSVRSAIEKLAALNILSKKRGGGSFVNKVDEGTYLNNLIPFMAISGSSYHEILEYRSYMDVLAVELFIKNADKENKENLQSIFDKMRISNGGEEFFLLDMDFHQEIASGSQNKMLSKVNQIIFNILKYNYTEEYHKLPPAERIEEHKKILDAILDRDIEMAKLSTKLHILRSLKDLDKIK